MIKTSIFISSVQAEFANGWTTKKGKELLNNKS